jgi:hypothetical protein
MLKLTVAVLAVALAGTASAGGWRNLRIDGSSEADFVESVAAFKEELPLARWYAFAHALNDIWLQGVTAAKAANREYTASDYFRQTDGLEYDEVVTLLDPTGETARAHYREASRLYTRAVPRAVLQNVGWPSPENQTGPAAASFMTPRMIEHALQPAPR